MQIVVRSGITLVALGTNFHKLIQHCVAFDISVHYMITVCLEALCHNFQCKCVVLLSELYVD